LANTSRGTLEILLAEGMRYVAAADDEMLSTINDSNVNNEGRTTSNKYSAASDHSTAKVAKAMAIASQLRHTQ